MLERDVDVGDEARLARHELEDRVVERLRIGVEEADPGERPSPRASASTSRASPCAPQAEVLAVARRVLRDQDELRDALRLERPRLRDERVDRAAPLAAAHLRDRAEGAGVVAALADLQVRVAAAAREDARRRLVVEPGRERLLREPRKRRAGPTAAAGALLQLVEAEEGVDLGDLVGELAAVLLDHAAGDDDAVDLAPLLALDLLEDRLDRLLLGLVDEPAGVDDDDARLGVRHDRVPRALQMPEHDLGVDEVLRAAERDDADGRKGLCLMRARSSFRAAKIVAVEAAIPRQETIRLKERMGADQEVGDEPATPLRSARAS